MNKTFSKGVTLIELLVVVSISAVLMAIVTNIYSDSQRTYFISQIRNKLQQSARLTTDIIRQDIQRSSAVLPSYSSYSTGPNTIVLNKVHLDNNGDPVDGQYDYIIFRRNPSDNSKTEKISIISGNSQTKILNTNSASLVFTYFDRYETETTTYADAIQINISTTLSENYRDKTYQNTYTDSATLRNH